MIKKLAFACTLTLSVAACSNPVEDFVNSIDVAGMALEAAEKEAASVGGKAVKVVKGEATKLVVDAGTIAGAAVALNADALPAGVESAILKIIPAPAASFPSGDQNYENQGPAVGVTLTNAENGEKVKLASAATVTVPLADDADADQVDLAHYSDDGKWEMLDGETVADNTLSGTTTSFSTFGAVTTGTTTTADTVAPDTTIDSGPANESTDNNATASFTFSCNESNCSFDCKTDNESFAACTSPKTTGTLDDGAHSFTVRAKDAAGNVDATPAARFWNIDTTIPDTTDPVSSLISGPAQSSYTSATSATFGLSCDEGSCTYFCALDTLSFSACTTPHQVTTLSDGLHTFYFYAVDAAQNAEAIPDGGRSWTVDTAIPNASYVTAPTNSDVTTATVHFECGDTSPCTIFQCKLDDANYAACTSPQELSGLADGEHTFTIQAKDEAGLWSAPTPTTWTTTLTDVSAPQTTIDTMPQAATSATTATFTFSASEEGSTFECSLNGAEFAPCESPVEHYFLGATEHSFQVRATDLAMNTDTTPAVYNWTVDNEAPIPSIDTYPEPYVLSDPGTFTFSCNEASCTFLCSFDEAPFEACTSPKNYTGISEGAHYLYLKAVDAAGNVSQMVERSWFNTSTPP